MNFMNLEKVEKIANAVLYEGYILYPYRPSAIKNQQRWNFGAVYPEKFSEMQNGTDACLMRTECLISGDDGATLDVKIRFLQMVTREVGRTNDDFDENDFTDSDFQNVQSLEVGGKLFQTWQEAVEREFDLPNLNLSESAGEKLEHKFSFAAESENEFLRDENEKIAGIIVRKKEFVEGKIEIKIEKTAAKNLYKVNIQILNETKFHEDQSREDALNRAFVSTHTILKANGGEFVSLLDPPEEFKEIAENCKNIGTFPILVGEEPEKDFVLSSPIILYDYPQIAPESMGDYFDGTEIDEMLALRIMTLTDDEKHQMRGADERTRAMLERTETMSPELMMKLHGTSKRDLKKVGKGE